MKKFLELFNFMKPEEAGDCITFAIQAIASMFLALALIFVINTTSAIMVGVLLLFMLAEMAGRIIAIILKG